MSVIGIFGGTFDPIHKGHIQMAKHAMQLLDLDEVRMLPCHRPPHRSTPQLTSYQRLCLLELAIKNQQGLVADDRELKHDKPSYTVETLEELRVELGTKVSLVFLMGADSYEQLSSWHRWQDIIKLVHIAIFLRPGYELPRDGVLAECLNVPLESSQTIMKRVQETASGFVFALNQEQIDLSATDIRLELSKGIMPEGLDTDVQDYIRQHQLYGFKKARP